MHVYIRVFIISRARAFHLLYTHIQYVHVLYVSTTLYYVCLTLTRVMAWRLLMICQKDVGGAMLDSDWLAVYFCMLLYERNCM